MPNTSVDLTNCDREPIHTPGRIQDHGCMLVSGRDGRLVLRASANAQAMLGLTDAPQDRPLQEVLGGNVAHDLMNALAKSTDARRPGLLRIAQINGRGPFDVAVHLHQDNRIMEFEPVDPAETSSALDIVRALIARTVALSDVATLAKRMPLYMQSLFGYDRVMLYQFAPDGSGKVIGEAKRPELESFLGQHFPAADIPKQARALYLRNTIRVIADANGPYSAIVPEIDASGARLDLSYAHLRSVSPIHLEYLRNMGVGASMSLSVIVGGELWGMVACHHYGPKALSQVQRVAAEIYTDFLSLHLTALHHRRRAEATLRTRSALDSLLANMSSQSDAEGFLRDHLADLAGLIECDGVGLWMNGGWSAVGSAPPPGAIPALTTLASAGSTPKVLAAHSLAEQIPEAAAYAAAAAGMLSIPLSVVPKDFLFFFRKEKVQTLEWGGDPTKTYEAGPMGDRLTPRKSFAIWKETVEGRSEEWTEDQRIVAEAILLGLREVILRHNEVLASERKKAEVRQRVLHDELNHRVKNILALIKSLIGHPTAEGETLEAYVQVLKGRIQALSHAHDQIVRADGGGSLLQLLSAELSPYPGAQIVLEGEDIGLDAQAYSVMALVIHELATNAAKYGSLSTHTGQLNLSFQRAANGDCALIWRESKGPKVKIPERSGFGSILLTRSVPYDLQGTSEVIYAPEGVQAHITIPAKFISPHVAKRKVSPAMTASPIPPVDFETKSILLVEDQLVIALDAEDMLRSLGAQDLTTVATAAEALKRISVKTPDLAVLDFNLGSGTTSLEVAQELMRREVPFVFATGYGDSVMIPEPLRKVPVVRKPYSAEALQTALTQLISA